MVLTSETFRQVYSPRKLVPFWNSARDLLVDTPCGRMVVESDGTSMPFIGSTLVASTLYLCASALLYL